MCEAIIQMQNSSRNEGFKIGKMKASGLKKNEGIEIGRNQQLRKIAVKLLASGLSREAVANFLEISNTHLELVLSEEDK